ncbi:hypothetical protein PN36_34160 [Candidatus Thiomargarita nelsonii]|uniref:DUF2281 domain-containing protein n=1 Tax=Candidatus Thiomargarita nelsonii TaxID=1003181 RepID=A0A0A6RSW4_9GAMM|nr:hypothetical protein PN36_34160 [Candidatus Thiomargarita nelsonii]
MNPEKLLDDVISLPQFAQQEVIDFIAFMKERHGKVYETSNENLPVLENEPFIGMWRNRDDMHDSRNWVRNLRQNEWS